MKSEFVEWIEAVTDTVFSELWQAKAIIALFGILGVVAFIGAFWNPWQLLFAAMCAAMVLCGISEYKKHK